jgi:hypothetical protein
MRTIPLLFLLAILPGAVNAQQNPPPDQDKRSEDVVKRGEHVMGFSHEATTHPRIRLVTSSPETTDAVHAFMPDPAATLDQAVAIEHHMNGAFGRDGNTGKSADQALADFSSTPGWGARASHSK